MIPQATTTLFFEEPVNLQCTYSPRRERVTGSLWNTFLLFSKIFISQSLFTLRSFELLVEYCSQLLKLFFFIPLEQTCGDFNTEHTVYCSVCGAIQTGRAVFFIVKHWTVLFSTLLISQRGMAMIIAQSSNHLERWRKCNFLDEGVVTAGAVTQWLHSNELDNGGREVRWAAPAGLLLTLAAAPRDTRPESNWVA